MYSEQQVKAAFSKTFRGAGELWFPYAGLEADIDRAIDEQWCKLAPNLNATQPTTRILVVGMRRFTRPDAPPWTEPWTWQHMLRCPGLDAAKTPTAWQRLHDMGLRDFVAVDLLPPGREWDPDAAIDSALYLRGIIDAMGYSHIVMLGGKVADAFTATDDTLADLRLLEVRDGFVVIPSPHYVSKGEGDKASWWDGGEKTARLRRLGDFVMSGRCSDCVNGDSTVDGCVRCRIHADGCACGEFCVVCRVRPVRSTPSRTELQCESGTEQGIGRE